MDFSFGFGLGSSAYLLSGYNPLINYDWSTTTTSGLRYLKDVGSTPTYNASMYFGRGAYFNGVDQGIKDIPYTIQGQKISLLINAVTISYSPNQYIYSAQSNPLIWRSGNLIRVYIGGVNHDVCSIGTATSIGNIALTVDEGILKFYLNSVLKYTAPCGGIAIGGTAKLGYDGYSSSYTTGILKDAYMFNRTITQAEITQAYEQPESFYAMAQADSTCVLNMPMCETDGYVRNMKTYSKGSELVTVVTGYGNNTVTKTNDVYTVTVIDDIKGCFVPIPNVLIGDKVLVSYEIISSTATTGTISSWFGLSKIEPIATFSHINTSTRTSGDTSFNKLNTGAVITFKVSVKKLTGVSFIQNYTSSVRNNAKNLRYGLQTCKFVRDSLGVIQSASDYLEGDTVGYADTGWVLQRSIGSFSIEFIQKHSNNGIFHISGRNESVTQRFYFGESGAGRSVVRYLNTNQAYGDTKSVSVGHTVISFDFDTNEMLVYFRGAYIGSYALTSFVDFSKSIILGSEGSTVEKLEEAIRLFKVHQKALTQEEVTKAYTDAVNKGLLS